MRKMARSLGERAGVDVEASYDGYGSDVGWYLVWRDGPTVTTMRRWAASAARGLSDVDATSLRYRRERTELAVVVAFLAHVLPQPAMVKELAWSASSIYEETEFPGRVDPEAWEMAQFALAQPGIPGTYDESGLAIEYIARVGLNGLRLDMWLASHRRQSDCQPDPPAVDPALMSEQVRSDLGRMIERVQAELVGGSAHRDDPRVQLLVAETSRHVLLQMVDQHQRRTAAHALVDGIGLSSLSSMIGLAPRTLGMRWGKDLDADLAPLTWLRDHSAEWAAACVAAAQAVRQEPNLYTDSTTRQDVWTLEQCDPAGGWRELTRTPAAVRRLLAATRRTSRRSAEEALRGLEELLDSYDRAEPPGRRERALRRPATAT